MVESLYRPSFLNLTPDIICCRLGAGTGSPAAIGYLAPPLLALPWLAPIVGYAATLSVLAAAVWQVRRLDNFDARFGVMAAGGSAAVDLRRAGAGAFACGRCRSQSVYPPTSSRQWPSPSDAMVCVTTLSRNARSWLTSSSVPA